MKKVSVQFNTAGRWAITNEWQVVVSEGEVVSGLPVTFAHIVMDAERGEIVDNPDEFFEEDLDPTPDSLVHSYSELYNLNMKDLRTVGDSFSVKDNKKDDLIDKVLSSQVYDKDYLDTLNDLDLVAVAIALELDPPGSDDDEFDSDSVVASILEAQEASEE